MNLSRFIFPFLTAFIVTPCYCQNNNDSLKLIFSSDEFSIEENYIGDWGGHVNNFTIQRKTDKIRVIWKNPEMLNNGKDLDVYITGPELKSLEKIFLKCSDRIVRSDDKSTEHIIYSFRTGKTCYVIDDHFTMECHEEFRAWKEMLEIKGQYNKD